jgi:hypothetical protein
MKAFDLAFRLIQMFLLMDLALHALENSLAHFEVLPALNLTLKSFLSCLLPMMQPPERKVPCSHMFLYKRSLERGFLADDVPEFSKDSSQPESSGQVVARAPFIMLELRT